MAIEVRDGDALPMDRLLALYAYAPWATLRTVAGVKEMLAHTDLVASAWDRDQLVGFGRVLTDRVYRAMLYDIIVHPDYQGLGVGRAVVEHLIHHPLLEKVPVIALFTRDKQSFYERLGFVSDERMGLTGMILVREGTTYDAGGPAR